MKKFRPISVLPAMLLAALPLVTACQGQSGSADQALAASAQVTKAEVPGIKNFSRLGGATGFGGATRPSAMARLKDDGFAAVINLRLASESDVDVDASRAAAETAGLTYIYLPFDAANPDPQLVPNFLAAVGDEANQPVYIHCASATRVAGLWMIKRVLEDGWEIDQARVEAEAIAMKPEQSVAFATKYIEAQIEQIQ